MRAPRLRWTMLAALAAFVMVLVAGVALWGQDALTIGRSSNVGLTANALDSVGVFPPPGAKATLDLPFTDDQGVRTTLRQAFGGAPGVLIFADYSCTSLCGPALTLTRAGLASSGLAAGRDYRVAVVGLNPKDGGAAARKMVDAEIGGDSRLRAATRILLFDSGSTPAITRALGYRYQYDAARGQYAHPVAALILTPDGRLTRALSEIGLSGADLRLALTEAAGGRIGAEANTLRLHCYAFNPSVGVYDGGVTALMKIAGLLMLAALGLGVALLAMRSARRSAAA